VKKNYLFIYSILFIILFLFIQNTTSQIVPPPLQLKDSTKIDSILPLHYKFSNNKTGKLYLLVARQKIATQHKKIYCQNIM